MERFNTKPEKTILYLNSLPENIYENDLKTFFKDFKDDIVLTQIDHNNIQGINSDNTSRALVIFKTSSSAKTAFNTLSMRKLRGVTTYIQYHKDQIIPSEKTNNLFVKGLPTCVTQREIFEKFLSYGEIISAKLCEDGDGNHLGYGYFNFATMDSVNKVLNDISNGTKFFGVNIQAAQFQKKNEREVQKLNINKNKNIYIKNLSSEFTQEDLISLFEKYGKIEWSTIKFQPERNSKFAIISYESEDSSKAAIEFENEKNGLFVDYLQTKAERKRIISNKIINMNFKLNSQYRESNLHIRNLPKEINEEALSDIFNKYGEIKSLKIPKFILVSKVNGNLEEITQSKLFGYVCFEKKESALEATNALNGKICPGFEDIMNRPLIIENFMPKNERKRILLNAFNILNHKPIFFNFNTRFVNEPLYLHPTLARHVIHGRSKKNFVLDKKKDEEKVIEEDNSPSLNVDLAQLNMLKSEEEKKDYLGEIIYRKIENHSLRTKFNFSIEVVGKITGMILAIDDIMEIFSIAKYPRNLYLRISQALKLLGIDKSN